MDFKIEKILDIIKKYKFTIITLMIISFIIFIGLIYYFYMNYKSSTNKEAFTEEAKIMMFHVDWCPHCKKALPDWNSFKNDSNNIKCNNKPLKIIDYDVTDDTPNNKELLNKYGIKGYPTILLDNNGKITELELKPTKENLQNFIKKNC